MKTSKLFLLVITVCIVSCSTNDEASNEQKTNNADTVSVVTEQSIEPKQGELLTHQERIKEELFFYLRNEIVKVDKYTFIIFEELTVEENKFNYIQIYTDIDKLLVVPDQEQEQASFIPAFDKDIPIRPVGDTLTIEGSILYNENDLKTEEAIYPLEVNISGNVEYFVEGDSNPYGYGYGTNETIPIIDYLEEQLVVDVNNPRLYPRDQFYLKCRVKFLTEDDLTGFSQADLAFLRNEIFARHGHAFKTSKMKDYFMSKPWYYRCNEDATGDLNAIEKRNVQFIKSLES